MEYQARQLARGLSANCFLVDLLEEYCNEPSRMRGRACTMACGFGLAWGTKPPCARAAPRLLDGVARRPMRHRVNSGGGS